MEIPEIEFNAKALAPVALAPVALFMAGKDDFRWYRRMLAVLQHPSQGCVIAATDGHQIAIWYDKDGKCSADTLLHVEPGIVAASDKRYPVRDPLRNLGRRIILRDGRLVLEFGHNEIWQEKYIQAGKAWEPAAGYPKIAKVLPHYDSLVPGMVGGIAPVFMAKLAKVAKIVARQSEISPGYSAMRHYTHNGDGLIITRFYGVPEFMVGTMPIRCADTGAYPAGIIEFREDRLQKIGGNADA